MQPRRTCHFPTLRQHCSAGALLCALLCFQAPLAIAGGSDASPSLQTLDVQAQHFVPAELHVPANQRIELTVHNRDSEDEEFESHVLNRERIVRAGTAVVIQLGPLAPGRYPFFGDYHRDTAQGVVIAE